MYFVTVTLSAHRTTAPSNIAYSGDGRRTSSKLPPRPQSRIRRLLEDEESNGPQSLVILALFRNFQVPDHPIQIDEVALKRCPTSLVKGDLPSPAR